MLEVDEHRSKATAGRVAKALTEYKAMERGVHSGVPAQADRAGPERDTRENFGRILLYVFVVSTCVCFYLFCFCELFGQLFGIFGNI